MIIWWIYTLVRLDFLRNLFSFDQIHVIKKPVNLNRNFISQLIPFKFRSGEPWSRCKSVNWCLGWIPGLKIATDSVYQADSRDIKILVQTPKKSILKFLFGFWNCVGFVHMRRRIIHKIIKWVHLFTVVILIYLMRGSYLILRQPTQFQPP